MLFSCTTEKKGSLKELFSFKIGYEEKELAVIAGKQTTEDDIMNFFYKNGFYYISDGINNKIMKLTEKGEPILTIYNKENYPHTSPTENSNNEGTGDENIIYIKLFKQFDLFSPGIITADINKNIYVINKNPADKQFDGKDSVSDEMVVKFDTNGNFLYRLGREGINRAPFGYILRMITDNNNNLVIIERVINGIKVYQFSPEGKHLKSSDISISDVPIITNEEKNVIIDFVDFIPGYVKDEIYITCQYISKEESTLSISKYDTLYEKIFRYSLASNRFEQMVLKVLPEYEDLTKYENPVVEKFYGDKKKVMKPIASLIGIDEENKIYLYQRELPLLKLKEDNELVTIYFADGKFYGKNRVVYPLDIDFHSKMFLSPDGKVFSYFISKGEVHFALINN